MSDQKSIFKKGLFIIPLLLIMGFISWNNKDSKNQQTAVLTDSKNSAADNKSFDLRNFPVLSIEKARIIQLFEQQTGEPKVHKLVFKFHVDLTKPYPTLAVFRAKRNDRKYISPETYTTLTPTSKTCEISGVYTLGNLELRRRVSGNSEEHSWEKILAKLTAADTHLYFYPMKVDDHVTYVLVWGGATPLDCEEAKKLLPADGGLNPSPPADPS